VVDVPLPVVDVPLPVVDVPLPVVVVPLPVVDVSSHGGLEYPPSSQQNWDIELTEIGIPLSQQSVSQVFPLLHIRVVVVPLPVVVVPLPVVVVPKQSLLQVVPAPSQL
jgi:signal-induced proliferation-associated 1 like protein 3